MNSLPDWTRHGYHVLSELTDESDRQRVIYRATRGRKNPRHVFIKHWRFGQQSGWQGFEQTHWEIRLLQELDHTRILKYLDQFEVEDGLCLVQDARDVKPLSDRLSFDLTDFQTIAVNLLELLEYLHGRVPSIVFSNLRPQTILVNQQNLVYLRDFQWAQIKGKPLSASVSGETLPGFVPPEQLGNSLFDETLDLYALGMSLISALSARSPRDLELRAAHGEFSGRQLLEGEVPDNLITWLEHLVQRQQSGAFQAASEAKLALLEEVTAPVADTDQITVNTKKNIPKNTAKPITTAPTQNLDAPTPKRLQKWGQYTRVVAAGAGITVLGLSLVLLRGGPGSAPPQPDPVVIPPPAAVIEPTPDAAIAPLDEATDTINPATRLSQAVKLIEEADVLSDQGEDEKALALIDGAIALTPEAAEPWAKRCWLLNNLDRHREALTACDQAIEINPDYYWPHSHRGWALRELERDAESLQALTTAVEQKPDFAWSWYQQGRTLQGLDRYPEAIAAFQEAVSLESDYYQAWQQLGFSQVETGQPLAALESTNQSLELRSDFADALYVKARALYDLERYEEALTAIDRSIELLPGHRWDWLRRGEILTALDRPDEAIAAYDQALEIDPEWQRARDQRAQLLGVGF
ncbi:MAG: protein kinase family protein [Cyanobacteria bacterium P01_H01_bin.121]